MKTLGYWFKEFHCGRTRVSDEEHPGRLIEVVTEEMIEKFHRIVFNDRQKYVRYSASQMKACSMSYTNIYI